MAVVGRLVSVDEVRRDGKVTGVRCWVQTDDGAISTKIKLEVINDIRPTIGDRVAWLVRPGTFVDDEGATRYFTQFVREVNASDIDLILSASKATASA
jgi:hypothetical protein